MGWGFDSKSRKERQVTPVEERESNVLGTAPIGRLMLKLAVPAVAAQFINMLYNIVDRIYIGHIPEVGDLALTGVGVTFPIITLVSAFAAFAGQGGAPLAAIQLGAGKKDQAERILGNSLALLLMTAAVLTVGFSAFKEPILRAFGASDATIGYASSYIGIYLLGTVFVQLALGLNNFITTQGFSTTSMLTVVIGAVCNIVLDPIFIFGLDLGVQGAALATILSQAVSAVWVLAFLTGRKSRLKIRRRHLRLDPKVLLPVAAIGVSPFIMQSTESLVNIALNSSLKHYGSDTFVGAMTIASSVMQVLTMPFMGLSQGAQPIIGYNYGAGNTDRVKRTFRMMFAAGMSLSILGFTLVQLFPGAFIAIFNDKPELVQATEWAMHIYFGGMFMLGMQFSCQQTFVALGQARVSLFLALLRKIVLLIPLVYLLPRVLPALLPPAMADREVFSVYLAEPIADICAATVTGLVFLWKFPRILKKRTGELSGGPA